MRGSSWHPPMSATFPVQFPRRRRGKNHTDPEPSAQSRLNGLLPGVGRAISDYLRHGRPRSRARQVFLRPALLHGQPITRAMVANAVARGWSHSAAGQPAIGPHVLRHSAASLMHARGATFKEIADVLGHQLRYCEQLKPIRGHRSRPIRCIALAMLDSGTRWPNLRKRFPI